MASLRVKIYEERLAGAVEWFISCLYREPWSHSDELAPHDRWEGLKDAHEHRAQADKIATTARELAAFVESKDGST